MHRVKRQRQPVAASMKNRQTTFDEIPGINLVPGTYLYLIQSPEKTVFIQLITRVINDLSGPPITSLKLRHCLDFMTARKTYARYPSSSESAGLETSLCVFLELFLNTRSTFGFVLPPSFPPASNAPRRAPAWGDAVSIEIWHRRSV